MSLFDDFLKELLGTNKPREPGSAPARAAVRNARGYFIAMREAAQQDRAREPERYDATIKFEDALLTALDELAQVDPGALSSFKRRMLLILTCDYVCNHTPRCLKHMMDEINDFSATFADFIQTTFKGIEAGVLNFIDDEGRVVGPEEEPTGSAPREPTAEELSAIRASKWGKH